MSTAINLLSDATKSILEKSRYSQDRTNILNSHKAMAYSMDNVSFVASSLGIDLDEAEYTFTAVKTNDGVNVYSPYIGNYNGEPAIFWGKVRKPLSVIALAQSIEEVGEKRKRAVLTIELPEVEDSDDVHYVQFSIMLSKDKVNTDARTLGNAHRRGKLTDYLAKPFEKPKKLIELEPGEYQVISYKEFNFSGDIKYTIEVKDYGFFNANTKLRRKLVNNPVITLDQPATLLVGESTETTSTGHPIVPVDLTTVEDTLLPVFDF